ncbi:ATPase family AAA domain-containing protein 5 [Sesamum alatum]|uniref:ATPase family AAA domain-containing protein 5 n=1 Tax=Sesamum alatum TaxID=300844 RepID=A0AAE1YHF4_9LAMI|nr:ATPase family AAA domain-containing protein 5 [Sesamum alatum]
MGYVDLGWTSIDDRCSPMHPQARETQNRTGKKRPLLRGKMQTYVYLLLVLPVTRGIKLSPNSAMEGKDVRRRLVQSALFPRRESVIKEGENCGGNGEEEVSEEEERCGSSKRRRGSKVKANSRSKTTLPASSKKVIENGKETSSKQVDDSDSPVPVKSSFFVKASERPQQKSQQNQPAFTDSPEENDEINSPPISAPMEEQPLRTIPDLRLEAKLTAEENSRIFAGRQIHPFFTSWKAGKTSQDLTDSESKLSSFERKDKGITFNPIHVLENVEDDCTTFDWGHWAFSEKSAYGDLECGYSTVYEGSVDSLNFDNFMNVSRLTRISLYQNCHLDSVLQKEISIELPDKPEHSHPISSLPLASLADERVICSEEQKDPDIRPRNAEDILTAPLLPDHEIGKKDLFAGTSCRSLESELQDKLLEERIMSHYHTCHNQPENCLWTDKYQPQNAKQVCGNGEAVGLLSEWLHLWHRRGSLISRSCMGEDISGVQDIDHDYSDADYDTIKDEETLKNVLLITGPVGSGKSAAIYACARDQGFQVIEINASDWRTGALVKQKFGEAVESHWLQRAVESGTNSDNKSLSKFFKAVNAEAHCSDNEVYELIHLSDEEALHEAGESLKVSVSGENRTANCQNQTKTLILFEDIDATLDEDHGFITTIQQLAETAKRPMILTSNSDSPVLPKNLDRLELSFSVPSVDELLRLVHMICASEKAKIHPCLVERFVNYCQRDIRKTIMFLQFWCQGQTLGRGNEFHRTHWPVLFDLDAGHHILPKVTHFGYPSKLSELVAEEVVKSLTLMEETNGLMNTNRGEVQNDCSAENIHMHNAEPDPIKVKKEAMLSLQCSLLDEVECSQFEANNDLFDFSCSPIALPQQKGRRKINTVLSSDSEDEVSGGSIPLISAGVDINAEVLAMKNIPISQCFSTEIHHHPTRPIYPSEVEKLEDHCQLQERVDYSHIEDTSLDVSLVPESSFVPETEIINEGELYSTTVSYGYFVNAIGGNFIIEDQDSMPFHEPDIGAQPCKSLHILHNQEMLGNTSDTSVCQEEVGDSLKSETDLPRGYQLLDECSRMDFTSQLKALDNPEADQMIDFVKRTWQRLHHSNDLRKHVTAEEKTACQGLTFAHGMSNLIAEADLLLKDCQTLVSDSLGSSAIPSERTYSYSYYDNQLEMSSIIAQHGMCFYAKEIASLGLGSTNTSSLASEMLSSSASSVALGKLANQDQRKVDQSDAKAYKDLKSSTRSESSLCNILQNVVPPKSYLAAKGNALHEYISTLSQISRFDATRISECINRKQRRARVPRHYLSSGSLSMSSEEISLLGRYNSYQKGSFSS